MALPRMFRPVMRLALLALLGLASAGCAAPQQESPTAVTISAQRCSGTGYNPGTEAFINCMVSLGVDRDTATRVSQQGQGN